MIGGETRDIMPISLFLKSGDVIIMGGKSRLAYHAVPCMIQNSSPSNIFTNLEEDEDKTNWDIISNYMKNSRINMNVRQVRKDPK